MLHEVTAQPSRFPLTDPREVTHPVVRETFDAIERELGFGMVPNLFRALGTQPLVLRNTWQLFRDTVLQGTLPRTLKEMIGIVVSAANGSAYARDVHMHSLGVQGVSHAVLAMLASGEPEHAPLPPLSVAMLRLAQKAARQGPRQITDADLGTVRAYDVSEAEIAELFATINLFQYINSLTDLARVPVDAL